MMQDDEQEVVKIKPQPGFQEKVALSKADITIIGGAAGCGKSFIMLYLVLMYINYKHFRATYFRRTKEMIRKQGSLWDESTKLYPYFDAKPLESTLTWKFESGAIVKFEGIEFEDDLINYQGAQLPYQLFDELTQFTRYQFFFLISRNRGRCSPEPGHLHAPQIFASCNPDPDSWVAPFIEWYIDEETGYPIPERVGKIRYFIIVDDVPIWGDSKKELYLENPDFFKSEEIKKSGLHPFTFIKSFTFIGGTIFDNKKLIAENPQYLASLMAQSEADKDRFLRGNWKVRSDDTGLYNNDAIEKIFKTEGYYQKNIVVGVTNGVQDYFVDRDYSNNFITCDAAKFGRDLCVIFVWNGFTIVHITVFHKCSVEDMYTEIEILMVKFDVLRKNVGVDQDGIGGNLVKLGKYYGFMARREVAKDETMKVKENYKTRKDQCYFRSAERVNRGEVKCIITPTNCKIYDPGQSKPRYGTELWWNKKMTPISTLIKKQLRAIRRGEPDFEGGVMRLCTNTKEEQKESLGHSPDFADNFMIREDFEFKIKRKGKFRGM